MKAKRFLLAALLSVVGCVFALAGCGDEEAKNHDHEYDWTIVKAATCKEVGSRTGVCKICGKETTEDIPLAEHTLTGEITVIEAATCTKKGSGTQVCSVCGSTQPVEIDMIAHTLEHHDLKAATCREDGNIEYWHCTVCNNDFSDADGKNAVATTILGKEDVEHQYNENGVCTVCGARMPGAAHVCDVELVEGYEATCKATGLEDYYKCKECGKIYKDELAIEETTLEDLTIPVSNDHNSLANAVYYPEVESKNCAVYGTKKHYDCKVCGKHFLTAALRPQDELFDVGPDGVLGDNILQTPKSLVHEVNGRPTWVVRRGDATCVSTGWKGEYYECENCGLLFNCKEFDDKTSMLKTTMTDEDGKEYTPQPVDRASVTTPIDPNKHSETPEHHTVTEPTKCGKQNVGYKRECYECTLCHKLFEHQNYDTELKAEEVFKYGNHSTTMKHVPAQESTCVTKGWIEHWDCEACGEHFNTQTPAAETLPLTDDELYSQYAPHSFNDYRSNSRGHWRICTAEGCGTYEKDDAGDLLLEPHNFEEGGDDPTCTVCGYGNVNLMDYFEASYDNSSNPSYAILTGFKKDVDGKTFLEKSDETVLTFPDVDNLGIPVKEIAAGAFSANGDHPEEFANALSKITEIYIPNSITKVGSQAFLWTSLSDYALKNLKKIEFEPGPETVVFEGELTFSWIQVEEIVLPRYIEGFASYMFTECHTLENVVMPEKVMGQRVHILNGTFSNCTALKEIDFWCFAEMSFNLGSSCFMNNENLKTLYIPRTLSTLGRACLSGCTSITDIYFGGSKAEWTSLEAFGDQWNYNNATLQGDLEENGILHCGYTHDV